MSKSISSVTRSRRPFSCAVLLAEAEYGDLYAIPFPMC